MYCVSNLHTQNELLMNALNDFIKMKKCRDNHENS